MSDLSFIASIVNNSSSFSTTGRLSDDPFSVEESPLVNGSTAIFE